MCDLCNHEVKEISEIADKAMLTFNAVLPPMIAAGYVKANSNGPAQLDESINLLMDWCLLVNSAMWEKAAGTLGE